MGNSVKSLFKPREILAQPKLSYDEDTQRVIIEGYRYATFPDTLFFALIDLKRIRHLLKNTELYHPSYTNYVVETTYQNGIPVQREVIWSRGSLSTGTAFTLKQHCELYYVQYFTRRDCMIGLRKQIIDDIFDDKKNCN